MRFYTQQHQHYCGIDLHARVMYACILDSAGNVVFHKKLSGLQSLPIRNEVSPRSSI